MLGKQILRELLSSRIRCLVGGCCQADGEEGRQDLALPICSASIEEHPLAEKGDIPGAQGME